MKTSLNSRLFLVVAGLCTALSMSACSSPNPYVAHRTQLAASVGKINGSQHGAATHELEILLAETSGDAKKFAVQRYYALYLLTQAHMRASIADAFLTEPWPTYARSGIDSQASSSSKQPSRVGHMVAAMMYASLAKDTLQDARGGALVEDGEKVLPDELSGFDVDTAQKNLVLCMLVVQSALGFQSDVKSTIEGAREKLWTDAKAIALLDSAHFDKSLRPWIYFTLFDYLKTREDEETAAYRFGVLALESRDVIGAKRVDAFNRWLQAGSRHAFKCPHCPVLAAPDMRVCPTDQKTPLIEFEAVDRAPKPH